MCIIICYRVALALKSLCVTHFCLPHKHHTKVTCPLSGCFTEGMKGKMIQAIDVNDNSMPKQNNVI